MDGYQLESETYGELKVEKCLGDNIFVVRTASHRKQNLVKTTDDIHEIVNLMRSGWERFAGTSSYIMRAPEVSLCDLADVNVNPTRSLPNIMTFYRTIKSVGVEEVLKHALTQNYFNGLCVFPIIGDSVETEFRIVGTDKRVEYIPAVAYSFLAGTDEWKKQSVIANDQICDRVVDTHILGRSDLGDCASKLYERLADLYKHFGNNIPKPYAVCGVWQRLPKGFDRFMFILKAGIKYALGYIEDCKDEEKLMLWENHTGMSSEKNMKIIGGDVSGRKIAIIDRSYSGSTLHHIKQKVLEEGGIPTTISVFPKSGMAIKKSDYLLFLDRFVASTDVETTTPNWAEELFRDVSRMD
jgi:hypothetical protein